MFQQFIFRYVAGVPFLGSIPLDPRLAQCSDQGLNLYSQHPDSLVTQAYTNIVQQLTTTLMPQNNDTEMDVEWSSTTLLHHTFSDAPSAVQ